MRVKTDNLKDLLIAEEEAVDGAVRRAVRHALLTHKRAGNPVASWKDGRVVIIPAEEIQVEEAPDGSDGSRKD
jgi:secreted trypsin-like serine protease